MFCVQTQTAAQPHQISRSETPEYIIASGHCRANCCVRRHSIFLVHLSELCSYPYLLPTIQQCTEEKRNTQKLIRVVIMIDGPVFLFCSAVSLAELLFGIQKYGRLHFNRRPVMLQNFTRIILSCAVRTAHTQMEKYLPRKFIKN